MQALVSSAWFQEAPHAPQLSTEIHKCRITKERAVKITCSRGRVRLTGVPNKEQSKRRMPYSYLQSEHLCGRGGRSLKEKKAYIFYSYCK